MKTQQVILINLNTKDISYYDTIKEAEQAAEKWDVDAAIYTLFAVSRHEVVWDMIGEPVANLVENKKSKKKQEKTGRKGGWTEREVETLTQAIQDGKATGTIAKALHRTPGSVYQKAVKLGLKGGKKAPPTKSPKEVGKAQVTNW